MVTILLEIGQVKFILVSIYMRPSRDINESLDKLDLVINKYKDDHPIVICTDANARMREWDREENQRGPVFLDFLDLHSLARQYEGDSPTFESHQGKSIVDFILANEKAQEFLSKATISKSYLGSDHVALECTINGEESIERVPYSTRKYRIDPKRWPAFERNLNAHYHIIEKVNFKVKNKKEADHACRKLKHYLDVVSKKTFKKSKPRRKHKDSDWLTSEVKRLVDYAAYCESKWKKCRVASLKQEYFEEYTEANRAVKKEIEKNRNKNWREFTSSKEDPHLAYKLLNICQSKRTEISSVQDSNGEYTTNDEQTAEVLMNHFYPNNNHPPLPDIPQSDCPQHRVKLQEIWEILKHMANNKAPGNDGITVGVIKKAFMHIGQKLEMLFNSLIKIKYFPDIWKQGIACIIPKGASGATGTPKDYRPITLLPIFGKIFEKFLSNWVIGRLEATGKLHKEQYGFMKQRSTSDALVNLNNFIRKSANKKHINITILLDITGAFDNAEWAAILNLLVQKDIPADLVELIKSYFTNRRITVRICESSKTKTTTQGVPQGSVSGPIFWNILIDDLLQILETLKRENEIEMIFQAYADDLSLSFSYDPKKHKSTEIASKINGVLTRIEEWGNKTGLNFNPSKTQVIMFTNRRKVIYPRIVFRENVLKYSNQVKYLGIWFDHKLNFNYHIDHIAKRAQKIHSCLIRFCRNTWGIGPSGCDILYNSVILPTVSYGSEVWAVGLKTCKNRNRLRSAQRICAIRTIAGYRTTSELNAITLTGNLPIELKILEKANIEKAVREGKVHLDEVENHTTRKLIDKIHNHHGQSNAESHKIQPKAHWLDREQCKFEIKVMPQSSKEHFNLVLYTDGSKTENGVGSGFSVFVNGIGKYEAFRTLNPICSVFQAELFGILSGLQYLKDNNWLLKRANQKILIVTDSMESLQAITNSSSYDYLVVEIAKVCLELNGQKKIDKICARWQRSHQEPQDEGSKLADHMAKYGARISTRVSNYDFELIPSQIVRDHFRRVTQRLWLEEIRGELHGRVRNFLRDHLESDTLKSLMHSLTYYSTQFITGHGNFSSFLKLINVYTTDRCVVCGEKDSPEHTLLDCPISASHRETIQEMRIFEPEDFHKFLKPKNTEKFNEICRSIIMDKNRFCDRLNEPH